MSYQHSNIPQTQLVVAKLGQLNEEKRQKLKHFKQKSATELHIDGLDDDSEHHLINRDQTKVYVKIDNTLQGINDLEQTFSVDIVVHLCWEIGEGHAHQNKNKKSVMSRTAPEWAPLLDFEYVQSQVTNHESYTFHGDEDLKNGVYYAKLNWLITMSEPLELERFPFDRQILTVAMSSSNCLLLKFAEMKYMFEGPHPLPVTFMPPDLLTTPDVSLTWEHDTWKLVKQHSLLETFVDRTSSITISIRVQRCPIFYCYNIGMVMFVIVASGFTVFATDPSDYGSRCSLLFTLLLTAVAFKFVTNSYIPMISYLTLMDRYILICFFFLASVIIESFLMSFFINSTTQDRFLDLLDTVFLSVYIIVWIVFNFVVFLATTNDFFGNLIMRLPWGDVVAQNNISDTMTCNFELEEEKVAEHHSIHATAIAMHYLTSHVKAFSTLHVHANSEDQHEYDAIINNDN